MIMITTGLEIWDISSVKSNARTKCLGGPLNFRAPWPFPDLAVANQLPS
jgi:hypothetical protein